MPSGGAASPRNTEAISSWQVSRMLPTQAFVLIGTIARIIQIQIN